MVSKINKIIIIILVCILAVFTIYKLNKKHEEKLYNVMYSKIEFEAKKCYLDKKCGKEITLKDLYDKKYLDILYDPISKEEFDSGLKISISEDKVNIKK